ncbi:MAG: Nramp family divalent metal transporter [Specibacter sp.]
MLETLKAKEGSRRRPRGGLLLLLGPAFVAAIAYVDPGNVAANLTSGASFGYLLVWVLVAANIMAMLVQYQSAKLGVVTGKSLPEHLGERLTTRSRRLFWVQAELVAMATDVAEVVGGAIALKLLFHVPLPVGGLIVGVASMALLTVQNRRGQKPFESVIMFLLVIITIGFLAGLVMSPPDTAGVVNGLIPRFQGTESVLLAAGMLGATVMPHAIYLHSQLAKDRHTDARSTPARLRHIIKATRVDVVLALILAGAVNIGMLLLAASTLNGVSGTDSIEGAHAAIVNTLGPVIGVVFAVGLLASGLASTSVGAYAGATIMNGLLKVRVPLQARRVVSLIPAIVLLSVGISPTWALIVSQVVLSFGIPFALIPLLRLTANKALMGEHRDGLPLRMAAFTSVVLIVALNALLLWLTLSGQG